MAHRRGKPIEIVRRQLERGFGRRDSGVVDEDVDPPERVDCLGDELLADVCLREIAYDPMTFARPRDLREAVARLLLAVATVEGEREAIFLEALRDRPADASVGPGDEGDTH